MRNKKLSIGINASFVRKSNTGIGQVSLNFLRELFRVVAGSANAADKRGLSAQNFKFILYLEEDLSKEIKLPKNFKKKIFLPVYKRDDLIRKIWWEKFLLPRQIKKDQCDILISLYQCPTVIKNTKHIMLVHDIIPKLFPEYLNNARKELYQRLTEWAIKKADKIIAVSKRTEKDLIQHLGINSDKITVNYIDVDEIYKDNAAVGTDLVSVQENDAKILRKYKLKPDYIFAGGGYEIRKNAESVIRAYKILLDRNKKEYFRRDFPKLVIYGKLMPQLAPLTTDAEKLIKELNLTKQVKLLGETPQKDMPALFRNASIFVYPSYYEGFGLPVLEAMNCGTPVIAGKISSLPEVGLDSVLYCHPNDIYDIAMVMKNLLVKKHLRDDLSQRGLQRAKNFSWEKFMRKILNIVSNL